MQHPVGKRHSVAVSPAGLRSCPGRSRTQKQRGSDEKGENYGAGAGSRDSGFAVGDCTVGAAFSVGTGDTGCLGDKLNEMGTVVRGDAAV